MIDLACQKEILASLKTKDEVRGLIEDLDSLSSHVFTGRETPSKALESTLPKKYFDIVSKCREKTGVDMTDIVAFNGFIGDLANYLKNVEVISLKVSFRPSQSYVESLFSWFSENIVGSYVLEIQTDPSIIGGCVLGFNGLLKDYSLSAKINKINLFS